MMSLDAIKAELESKAVAIPDDLDLSELPEITRPDKAIRAIRFIQTFCTHTKGKWAGKKFILIKWQFILVWRLFGQCKPDGNRQYRICYCEIPKKNGKSELAAAIALLLLVADDEIGGEVYSAAADKGQASLVYNVASQMVKNNPTLQKRLVVRDSVKRIADYKTNGIYQVLSAEVYTKHGINPSGIIFDELHAQPNDQLWRVLTAGTDYARSQQVVFAISTAGEYDIHSVWWKVREKARQIEEGLIDDPSFLPILYIADKDKDKPEDRSLWKRVNPSLGHIFNMEKIESDFAQAKQDPVEYIDFLRFRLNIPVNQVNRWVQMEHWDSCGGEIPELKGRACYGGIDLASKLDLTCFCLVFPPENDGDEWVILPKFYVPEETVSRRSKQDNVRYDIWVQQGFITATPGNVCDYGYIKRDVLEAAEKYDLGEVGYDPWGATDLATNLDNDHGIKMIEMRQGMHTLSEPSKDLLVKIMKHELNHGNNPVLRWCADNIVMKTDANENIMPAKDKATDRIDGMVALIMANGRAMFHQKKFKIRMPMAV